MFRNLTMYRFPTALETHALAMGVEECALRPVGPIELSTRGFVPPHGRAGAGGLTATLPGLEATWLAVGSETRDLPGSVVEAALTAKLDDWEQKCGRRPAGRTRKRLRDELVTELLPRAFVKPSRVDAILDEKLGVLFVDTASRKAGDAVVSEIRRALGSFPAVPLNAEVSPPGVLTDWLGGSPLPEGLALGSEFVIESPLDSAERVSYRGSEPESEDVILNLEGGMLCVRLALTLDDRMSFVLGEDLTVRKFKLTEAALESLENADREDMRAELDARFALQVGEFRRLFAVLEPALRLSAVE